MLSVFQAIPFELPRKPPTVNRWDSTLGTPGGNKYYNQYRPQCEVCPRDHGKVVESLRGTRERNMEMALLFPTLKLHTYYTPVHVFQSYVQLKIYVLYILNTEFLNSTANIKALRGSLGALSVNKLSHIPKLQPISAVYENQ